MSLPSIDQDIAARVRRIRQRIDTAARSAGRSPDSVHLVAASKTRGTETIRAAARSGVTDFAENYLQEAATKIRELGDLGLTWHFIGAIQSNKTAAIAELFHWVHTVDRAKIAERLSRQCPPGRVLDLTLQINVDDDPNKAGVPASEAGALLDAVAGLPNLRVRGLMTILRRPEANKNPREAAAQGYQRLARLLEDLQTRARGPWDALSMGMSEDFEAAVAAGATHIRVGTALFGPRPD